MQVQKYKIEPCTPLADEYLVKALLAIHGSLNDYGILKHVGEDLLHHK
jgi:hypothetical protein